VRTNHDLRPDAIARIVAIGCRRPADPQTARFAGPICHGRVPGQMMASVQAVKRRHEASLMKIRGVVGVGITRKEGKDCICVYVKDDNPKILAAVPRTLEEIPVEIVVSGAFTIR